MRPCELLHVLSLGESRLKPHRNGQGNKQDRQLSGENTLLCHNPERGLLGWNSLPDDPVEELVEQNDTAGTGSSNAPFVGFENGQVLLACQLGIRTANGGNGRCDLQMSCNGAPPSGDPCRQLPVIEGSSHHQTPSNSRILAGRLHILDLRCRVAPQERYPGELRPFPCEKEAGIYPVLDFLGVGGPVAAGTPGSADGGRPSETPWLPWRRSARFLKWALATPFIASQGW